MTREKKRFYVGRLRNPRRQGVNRMNIGEGEFPQLLEEAKEDLRNKKL